MRTVIERSRYKDQDAVTLRTELLQCQLIPAIGSNVCSLRWLPTGFELLRQGRDDRYLRQPYGGSFVAAERAGLDEMLPTIDACFCDRDPWKGVEMPDHGEVWSIPWDCRLGAEEVALSVSGVRFPYTFEKCLRFTELGTLRIDYRLENRSPFELPFLWAAHPDLALPDHAQILLPKAVTELVAVFSSDLEHGTPVHWPLDRGRDLRFVGPQGPPRMTKYYVNGRMPEGWCVLRHPKAGVEVRFAFPVDRVPYLAVLPHEGAGDASEVFLEPCTAPYDRPDLARLHGAAASLGPRASREWFLEITVRPAAQGMGEA